MRIAWLTPFLPAAQANGGDIASQNLIDGLRALGHEVAVHGYRSPDGTAPGPGEDPVGDPVGEASTASRATKARWLLRSLATGEPLIVVKSRSAAFDRRLRGAWDAAQLVVVDHFQLTWMAPTGRPAMAVVHNIESAVFAERARSAGGLAQRLLLRREARLLAAIERRMVRRMGALVALSAADAAHCAALGGRVVEAPLTGLATAVPADAHGGSGRQLADIGLLGLWTWQPNRRGLEWFVDEVLPRLPQGTTVAVAGRGADDLAAHPRLRVLGVVPDAVDFIRSCRVHAIPSIAGGGIQVKTINAIALGVAVVATPIAMRGITDAPPSVAVAEAPADFAAACLRLCRGPGGDPEAGAAWQALRRTRLGAALAAAVDTAMEHGDG